MATKKSVLQRCELFSSNQKSFAYRVCKSLKDGDFCDVLSSQKLTQILNEGAGKKVKVPNTTIIPLKILIITSYQSALNLDF